MGSIGQFIGHIIALNHWDLFSVRFSCLLLAKQICVICSSSLIGRITWNHCAGCCCCCCCGWSHSSSFSVMSFRLQFSRISWFVSHSHSHSISSFTMILPLVPFVRSFVVYFLLDVFWLILLWYIKTLNNKRLTDSIIHSLNVCQQWFRRSIFRWHFERLYAHAHAHTIPIVVWNKKNETRHIVRKALQIYIYMYILERLERKEKQE